MKPGNRTGLVYPAMLLLALALAACSGGGGGGTSSGGGGTSGGGGDAGDGLPSFARAALEAYVKASNTGGGDAFGTAVALSADGNTLAVGAPGEDSATSGVDGIELDENAPAAGAVYVFTRSAIGWSQQAYVKASNTGAGDSFGWAVALAADGQTLAAGALSEDSAATGIGGDQADDSAINAGAAYVYGAR